MSVITVWQVPTSWIYAFDDAVSLMDKYNLLMDGVSELYGYPKQYRADFAVQILYLGVDVQNRRSVYGVGYPQTNVNYNPSYPGDGNQNHWMLRSPETDYVCWHELGHAQQNGIFRYLGETEAIVNFLSVYLQHAKLGVDFDEAFRTSRGTSTKWRAYTPDDAAVHWAITPNFRNGREMDRSHTELDEFRYQHRGYGKYADIVRLYGWGTFSGYHENEQLSFNAAKERHGAERVTELGPWSFWRDYEYNLGTGWHSHGHGVMSDTRTLRWSVTAGHDIRPLIHFWGIHPVDPSRLANATSNQRVLPCEKIRCLLQRCKCTLES